MKIEELLSKFEYIAKNPQKMVEDYIKKTGNKAIGCFPVYTPEEIIHAGNMLPVGMWGTNNIQVNLTKEYLPAFACSIMQSCLELGLQGKYDILSGVVIPCMCDTLICIGQNWKSGIKHIPFIPFVHPQNRKLEAGIEYLVEEYKSVKKKLEDILGNEILEEDISKSIEIYNEHRKVMREFVELASSHMNTINSFSRSNIIKSSYFMRKEEHANLVKELNQILKKLPEEKYNGKSVLVTGILFDADEELKILDENNLRIAFDNLANQHRQFRTDVPDGKNALDRLARQWANIEGCSLAYDPKKLRGKMIVEEVKKRNIDGVIYALMKFCDPEEYDYPIIKKDLDEAKIPNILLEIDQQATSFEQLRTRVQTFSEILNNL